MFMLNHSYDKREIDKLVANFNPWRQRPEKHGPVEYSTLENGAVHSFEHYETNLDLDADTKRIALNCSYSVVSIKTYSGETLIFLGSGTIIESSSNEDGSFTGFILTSGSLFKEDPSENQLPRNLKVEVHLVDGSLYWGDLLAYDFHYNIAIVTINSTSQLQIAQCRCIRDGPRETSEFNVHSHSLRAHSYFSRITPGDKIVALGRLFCNKYSIMAAPGRYSLTACKLNCKELLTASCKITKCGIGGPIVNYDGNVIGVAFYDDSTTPFLPINVFAKWWEYYKAHKTICRPCIGLKVASLYTAPIWTLESIPRELVEGVIVKEVKAGCSYGLNRGDIIVQCCGRVVSSFLEFLEIVWDNFGKSIDVTLLKQDKSTSTRVIIDVQDTSPDDFYSWPLPRPYRKLRLRRGLRQRPLCVGRLRKSLWHKDYRENVAK